MAGFGNFWNGAVAQFKVLCIFVMAWCWFFATIFKPRNVKCNIFSELTLNASLLFFCLIILKKLAENFCVISEIWTELCRITLCWKYVAGNQTLRDRSSLRDNGKPKTKLCSKMLRCLLSSENIKLHLTAV